MSEREKGWLACGFALASYLVAFLLVVVEQGLAVVNDGLSDLVVSEDGAQGNSHAECDRWR